MKIFTVFTLIILSFGTSYSQLTWSSAIPPNPDYDDAFFPMEAVMYNNDVYQISDSVGYLEMSKYDSETGQWSSLPFVYNPDNNYNYRTAILNDKLYIFTFGDSKISSFKYDFSTQALTMCPGQLSSFTRSNWDIKHDALTNKIYLGYTNNDTEVHLAMFDPSTEQFTDYNYTTWLNSATNDLSGSDIVMYKEQNNLYIGTGGEYNQLGIVPLSNLSNFQYYNNTDSNDGYIRLNGTPITLGFYYLTGDGQNAPYITVQDEVNYLGYEILMDGADVDINTSTTTPNSFYTLERDHETLELPAYSFLASPFSNPLDGTNSDKFYLYRKDNGTQVWDSLGPKLEFGIFDIAPNYLRISLENSHQSHIAVGYSQLDVDFEFKVLNNRPSIISASQITSASMCIGHNNLIYPQLEIEDADIDFIRILNVSSSNGNVQNMYAVPIGVDNSSSPGLSKFAIYGFVATQGTTDIIVDYTDGFNTFTTTLNSINIVGSAPSIIFDPALSHLCDNEVSINLADYVNFYDNSTFKINGQVIPNSILNGVEWSAIQPSGSFTYDVNVDGCLVSTGGTYNFVNAGTASVTTSPATCGATNGSATVVYTQGTSSVYTVEWSTGETSPTINNLSPGAYYYHVTDDNGCHVTGFGGVETATIDVTESITNASCYGSNDGSIGITVAGPTNYSIIWSNGYSTPTISNLTAGTYWVTVTDLSNSCQVTYNYDVTQPSKVLASFTDAEPTCGASNGNIYGIYSGGSGSYTFEWIGTPQTTADLYNVPYGAYQLVIHDVNGCLDTFNYQLNETQALEIAEVIYPSSCSYNTGAIQLSFTNDPDGGTSVPNSVTWSNGAVGPTIGSLAPGYYTVTVENNETTNPFGACRSMKTFYVPLKAPTTQPICLVTVDSVTQSNLVIWEKVEMFNIDHYNIYRENTVAGDFRLIDTVQFSSESIFNDVVASPIDRSWRYRISQVDACGTESPLSLPHKTLHLNAIENLGNGTYDVLWDDYEGYIDASEYQVWRNSDQNGWELLPTTVPVGTTSFLDTPPAGLTGIDYYVKMVTQTSCSAEKVQDFNTTRSNKEKGNFIAGQGTGDSNNELAEDALEFSVHPNPVADLLTIVTETGAIGRNLHIYGLDGVEHLSSEINEVEMTIDLNQLSSGIYLIRLDNSNQIIRLVKN